MSEIFDKPIRMQIKSSPAHLPVVRSTVERICQMIGFDDERTSQIVLSVDEALTNVIRHAYQQRDGEPIDIEIDPICEGPGGIRIRLRDYGPAVDPSRIRSRDLDDVRPGGLGVHIMGSCMDSLDYAPAEGGGTVLTMVRHRQANPSGERA
jgi:anti-sigma regulatory factor (Ser/Thr protein kinase)